MNYLAHAYLSFHQPELLIGNLIADCIRGSQIDRFPARIQQGIMLHRKIDRFTDDHPINQAARRHLAKTAGRYSGSFLDIAYDHFLANDDINMPAESWSIFAQNCYAILKKHENWLPDQFRQLFIPMQTENWLVNYRHLDLVERSFLRLQWRARYLADDALIFENFMENYEVLAKSYYHFFPLLRAYAHHLVIEQTKVLS